MISTTHGGSVRPVRASGSRKRRCRAGGVSHWVESDGKAFRLARSPFLKKRDVLGSSWRGGAQCRPSEQCHLETPKRRSAVSCLACQRLSRNNLRQGSQRASRAKAKIADIQGSGWLGDQARLPERMSLSVGCWAGQCSQPGGFPHDDRVNVSYYPGVLRVVLPGMDP